MYWSTWDFKHLLSTSIYSIRVKSSRYTRVESALETKNTIFIPVEWLRSEITLIWKKFYTQQSQIKLPIIKSEKVKVSIDFTIVGAIKTKSNIWRYEKLG